MSGVQLAGQGSIFGPFFAMLLLTLAVWVYMYVRRLTYIVTHHIDAQDLATPEQASEIMPAEIHRAAYNFRNLFELPVVFYALCLYLFVTGTVDGVYVAGAWAFVALRSVHSLIHCTANIVILRFASYMLGALVLWAMVLRAALNL